MAKKSGTKPTDRLPTKTLRPPNTTEEGTESTTSSEAGSEAPESLNSKDPLERLIEAVQQSPFREEDLHGFLRDAILDKVGTNRTLLQQYNVIIFYDVGRLVRADADKMYRAVTRLQDGKPLLLVLHSPGGEIEPAYLMSKLCRERAGSAFHVAVPRRAKSAATLLACGADYIHMGSLSELGPIDPQIDGLPVLALKSALEHIARVSKDVPSAGSMLAEYLSKVLKLEQLGYYERVAESAVQYAERLLLARRNPASRAPNDIAQDLVYKYKDHGFVVDAKEANAVFGNETIVLGSGEYKIADHIYETLSLLEFVIDHFVRRRMYFIGTIEEGLFTFPRPKAS